MSSAARIARSGSSGCSSGAPHCAITASPMNLSSVPPCRNTQSTIALRNSETVSATTSGAAPAAKRVKPRRSPNSTVTRRLSPPGRRFSVDRAMRAATGGAKKRSKLPRAIASRLTRSASRVVSYAAAAMPANADRKSRSASSNVRSGAALST